MPSLSPATDPYQGAYAPPCAEALDRPSAPRARMRATAGTWTRAAVSLAVVDVAWLGALIEPLEVLARLVMMVGLLTLVFGGLPMRRRSRLALAWCAAIASVFGLAMSLGIDPWAWPKPVSLALWLGMVAAVAAFDDTMAQLAHAAGAGALARTWSVIGRVRLISLLPLTAVVFYAVVTNRPEDSVTLETALPFLLVVASVAGVAVVFVFWPAIALFRLARHMWCLARSAPLVAAARSR